MTVRGWFLPRALRSIVAEERVHTLGGVPVSMPVLAPDQLATIGAHLAGARDRVLAERSVDSIVAVLDALAEAWLDDDTPERQRALEILPRITGTSAAMIRESIDLEQASSRADHMERALRSEFGNPAVLDGFVDNPLLGGGGQTMAVGPTLTGAVFSSNIPALPHLTAMRSLLVKSAFWGRTSRREPTFLPLYLSTLERLDPDLAACTASLWWPREARELEEPFLAASDCFVGWGGPEAEAHFREAVLPETRFVFHGHRIGFAIVDADSATDDVARGLARDASLFDQQACLSPHVVFFRGDLREATAFGSCLANHMEACAVELPGRTLTPGEAAAIQQFRGAAEVGEALTVGRLFTPADGTLTWTVSVEASERFSASPLNRCITVCAVPNWDEAMHALRPLSPWLQNAAIAVSTDEAPSLKTRFARLGVTRLCAPGLMATPSMMWHHDGEACLASMVRWCDHETLRPDAVPKL